VPEYRPAPNRVLPLMNKVTARDQTCDVRWVAARLETAALRFIQCERNEAYFRAKRAVFAIHLAALSGQRPRPAKT